MQRNLTSLALMSALALAASGMFEAQGLEPALTETMHKTFPLARDGRVALSNVNGAVQITGWDKNEVELDAVKKADSKEALEDAQIVIDATADSISIRTKYPEHNRTRNAASVKYTLHVPKTARLSAIETVNGALTIAGVSGEVKASSVNGAVKAEGLAGDARLSTTNGRVEASFDRLDAARTIDMHSVNGALVVSLPNEASAEVAASTVHGGIRNDFGVPVPAHRGPGNRFEAKIGKSSPAKVKLHTVNGAIDIRSMANGRRVRSL